MKNSLEIPSLDQIRAYIQRNGWIEQETHIKNVYIYSNDQDLSIILPRSKNLKDYKTRIDNAINTLSDIEETPVSSLKMAMSNIFSDIIRVSISEKILKNGTIPLPIATEFITGLKDLMAYSATSEELKISHFQRTLKKGVEFSEACRFGHTFVGSFGFCIACPLERKKQKFLMDELEIPPFERKVVQRLSHGIAMAKEAYRKEDTSCITNGYQRGLSANMADQIVSLHDIAKNSDVKFNFSWSPEWNIDIQSCNNSAITIDYNFAEFIRSASKCMKEDEKSVSHEFIGLVVGLKSKNIPFDEDENSTREITIHLEGDDVVTNEVKIIASKEDYLLALDAHRNGRRVKFYGIVEKKGKKWSLKEYNNFSFV